MASVADLDVHRNACNVVCEFWNPQDRQGIFSKRFRLFALACVPAFYGMIGVTSGVHFESPIIVAILLIIPTAILLLRDRSKLLDGLLPHECEQLAPNRGWGGKPVWLRAGTYALVSMVLILAIAPFAPETLNVITRPILLDFTNWKLLILDKSRYMSLFLVGFTTASLIFLWVARDALWIVLGRSRCQKKPGHLLYDSDCGFCQRWCDWAKRRGAEQTISFEPCQTATALR